MFNVGMFGMVILIINSVSFMIFISDSATLRCDQRAFSQISKNKKEGFENRKKNDQCNHCTVEHFVLFFFM